MASCSREKLERKWTTEKIGLRHEAHVKLKQKLPLIAQAQTLMLNDDRKALLFLQDKSLIKLRQKLEAIASSEKQLSHAFHNSLAATLTRLFADALIKGKKSLGRILITEVDDHSFPSLRT